eukprot:gnl/Spiro4/27071_TR13464_c0_g1_i1.p1 gnl/Spiro4/27071_TR13464_c0_g1~~gnl/Spiro4/27071_TR13464_c0_g1_i1.p1  ORF type:complete len:146 (-),score=32.40 gnl/Spiro4/27071_TR13464_c0_g1_i1:214-621(-)
MTWRPRNSGTDGAAAATTEYEFERANNRLAEELETLTNEFSRGSTQVYDEVRSHRRLLDHLDQEMVAGNSSVADSNNRLLDMMDISNNKQIMYLVLGMLVVFFVLYKLVSVVASPSSAAAAGHGGGSALPPPSPE